MDFSKKNLPVFNLNQIDQFNKGALASTLSLSSATNGTTASSSSSSRSSYCSSSLSKTAQMSKTSKSSGLKPKAVSFRAKLKNKLKRKKSLNQNISSSTAAAIGIETIDENSQFDCLTNYSQENTQESDFTANLNQFSMGPELAKSKSLKRVETLSITLFDEDKHAKEDLRSFLSSICKLMDKSLSWLKIKSKSTNRYLKEMQVADNNEAKLRRLAEIDGKIFNCAMGTNMLLNELKWNQRFIGNPIAEEATQKEDDLNNQAFNGDSAIQQLISTPNTSYFNVLSDANLLSASNINSESYLEAERLVSKDKKKGLGLKKSLKRNKQLDYSTSTRRKLVTKGLKAIISKSFRTSQSSIRMSFPRFGAHITQQTRLHSTPSTSFSQQFSPILSQRKCQSFCSSSSSEAYSNCNTSLSCQSNVFDSPKSMYSASLPMTPSFSSHSSSSLTSLSSASISCKRLSFGVTSSPKSLCFQSESFSNKLDSMETEGMSDEFNGASFSANELNSNERRGVCEIKIDAKQQRLIDHINSIKESVKIGEESDVIIRKRHTSRSVFEVKRQKKVELKLLRRNELIESPLTEDDFGVDDEMELDENEEIQSSKRRKLRQIFQIKLQKQLKEIKKWQVGIRNDFESKKTTVASQKHVHQYQRRHRQSRGCSCHGCHSNQNQFLNHLYPASCGQPSAAALMPPPSQYSCMSGMPQMMNFCNCYLFNSNLLLSSNPMMHMPMTRLYLNHHHQHQQFPFN